VDIYAANGIRTRDPSIRAVQDLVAFAIGTLNSNIVTYYMLVFVCMSNRRLERWSFYLDQRIPDPTFI